MMYQEHFVGSDLLGFPLVALVIFFAVFVIVVGRVAVGFRRGTRMDDVAHLPLEGDAPARPGAAHRRA